MKMYGWDHNFYSKLILGKSTTFWKKVMIPTVHFDFIKSLQFPDISKSGWFLMQNTVKIMIQLYIFMKNFQNFLKISKNLEHFRNFFFMKSNVLYFYKKKSKILQKLRTFWMTLKRMESILCFLHTQPNVCKWHIYESSALSSQVSILYFKIPFVKLDFLFLKIIMIPLCL